MGNQGYFDRNVLPARKSMATKPGDKKSSSKDSGKDGDRVETNTKTSVKSMTFYQGRRVRETTKVITTTTYSGGNKSTSTKTEVQTEYINNDGGKKRKDSSSDDESSKGLSKLKIGGSKKNQLSSSDCKLFEKEMLDQHNQYRAKHRAPRLELSSKLSKEAQKWAEHLVSIKRLQHSDNRDMGENVAYKFSSDCRRFTGAEMTDMWYNEIKDYNFNDPGFKPGTGHFTQVVWENSKELGVGVATDGKGTCFAAANYKPAGNYRGQFPDNVKKPRS